MDFYKNFLPYLISSLQNYTQITMCGHWFTSSVRLTIKKMLWLDGKIPTGLPLHSHGANYEPASKIAKSSRGARLEWQQFHIVHLSGINYYKPNRKSHALNSRGTNSVCQYRCKSDWTGIYLVTQEETAISQRLYEQERTVCTPIWTVPNQQTQPIQNVGYKHTDRQTATL